MDGSDSGSQGTGSHGEGEGEDEGEEGDFYEELALADIDEVDPSVLSALAPSMQLNILQVPTLLTGSLRGKYLRYMWSDNNFDGVSQGMRDNQMRVNRVGFQDRQGRPNDFSTFQVEQFLKASQFRRVYARTLH